MTRGRTNRILTHVWNGERLARDPDEVAVEEPMSIHLDGVLVASTMRTPGHDFELAAGFCLTEGLLGDARILATKYCRDGGPGAVVESDFNVVTVDTGGEAPTPTPRLSATTSACGLCGSTAVDELRERIHPLPSTPGPSIEVSVGAVQLLSADGLFTTTGAVHVAALFDHTGTNLVSREDVGRHNAVDKIVGRRLLDDGLPALGLGLAVSGRVGFEIVQKAWAAGIGTVVAVGAPTSLAVQAATLASMTLVGWAGENRARVYTGGEHWR